jgi:AAA+ superfamily predicted ATPase
MKLLFHGPPGCGKSLTAQALGNELGIPVFLVRFDAIIGAYLGQTAIHLRQLFHFAETAPCVLLLDELDALGKKRGNPLDVGELDRIVIALLQELEHAKPMGIIIGTSNLPEHLDRALWRRFDLDVNFSVPNKAILRPFIKAIATKRKIAISEGVIRKALRARSFAQAEAVVTAEARCAIEYRGLPPSAIEENRRWRQREAIDRAGASAWENSLAGRGARYRPGTRQGGERI